MVTASAWTGEAVGSTAVMAALSAAAVAERWVGGVIARPLREHPLTVRRATQSDARRSPDRLAQRDDHAGRPGHGVVVRVPEGGEVVLLGDGREVPALVREHCAQDPALGA